MTGVTLAPASREDLDWIITVESAARGGGYVNGDTPERHLAQFTDDGCQYLIARAGSDAAGFVLLRGVGTSAIELKRIVIAHPGAGVGRAALRAVMAYAFETLRAHRLWLDVFEDNDRAQHVYRSVGFTYEGRQRDAARRNDTFVSLDLYSMLAQEYGALSKVHERRQ